MVAVVALATSSSADVARRLAADGFTVVILADDATAAEAGRLATDIQTGDASGRAAVILGVDGVVAFVRELFDR